MDDPLSLAYIGTHKHSCHSGLVGWHRAQGAHADALMMHGGRGGICGVPSAGGAGEHHAATVWELGAAAQGSALPAFDRPCGSLCEPRRLRNLQHADGSGGVHLGLRR